MTIRVLVADDQEIVRTGLRTILDAQVGIQVVAVAADGREAVRLTRAHRPDVCLIDLRMPVLDGVAATRELAGPGVEDPVPVVVITTFDLDEHVHAALTAGARGFLLKDAGPDLLAQAVRAAAAGDGLIDPGVTVRLLAHFAAARRPPAPSAPLTDREGAVLGLVAAGRTNSEIAAELHLSLSTVKTHLGSVLAKTGTRNRVEVARWAIESGLVRVSDP
jgi:DNA-binding NarL/FixJ family response regulator